MSKTINKRPIRLIGKTYKVCISPEEKVYITINGYADDPKRPYEIFLNSYSSNDSNYKALGVALSALCRVCDNIEFLIDDFIHITAERGVWWEGMYVRSLAHAIALALRDFMGLKTLDDSNNSSNDSNNLSLAPTPLSKVQAQKMVQIELQHASSSPIGEMCPQCKQLTLIKVGGCKVCNNSECTYVGECG